MHSFGCHQKPTNKLFSLLFSWLQISRCWPILSWIRVMQLFPFLCACLHWIQLDFFIWKQHKQFRPISVTTFHFWFYFSLKSKYASKYCLKWNPRPQYLYFENSLAWPVCVRKINKHFALLTIQKYQNIYNYRMCHFLYLFFYFSAIECTQWRLKRQKRISHEIAERHLKSTRSILSILLSVTICLAFKWKKN